MMIERDVETTCPSIHYGSVSVNEALVAEAELRNVNLVIGFSQRGKPCNRWMIIRRTELRTSVVKYSERMVDKHGRVDEKGNALRYRYAFYRWRPTIIQQELPLDA